MTQPFFDNYRFLARYNRWFNGRLYDACEKLGDEERKRDRGAFFGSIHDTLNHLVWGRHHVAEPLCAPRAWRLTALPRRSAGCCQMDSRSRDDAASRTGRPGRTREAPRRGDRSLGGRNAR